VSKYTYEQKLAAVQAMKARIYRQQLAAGKTTKKAHAAAAQVAERAAEKHDQKHRS
jgi:hypothetical protein